MSQTAKRSSIVVLVLIPVTILIFAAVAYANTLDEPEGPVVSESSPIPTVGSLDEAEDVMGFPIMTLPADVLPQGTRIDSIQVKYPMTDAVTQVWNQGPGGEDFVMLSQAPRPLGLAGGTTLSGTDLGENVESDISPAREGRDFAIGSVAWTDGDMYFQLTVALEPDATINKVVQMAESLQVH